MNADDLRYFCQAFISVRWLHSAIRADRITRCGKCYQKTKIDGRIRFLIERIEACQCVHLGGWPTLLIFLHSIQKWLPHSFLVLERVGDTNLNR